MITKLNKETIKKIVEESENPSNAIIELYKSTDPNFDNKESVGWSKVSETTNKFIFSTMIDKFKQQGGFMWMNYGFSSNATQVKDWYVEID